MPILENKRHELFAREVAKGKSQHDAYIAAYPTAKKWKAESVDQKASVLARDVKVRSRINELTEKATSDAVMSATELRERLSRKIIQADEKGVDATFIAASKLLADLCGYNAPAKTEQKVTLAQDRSEAELRKIVEGK